MGCVTDAMIVFERIDPAALAAIRRQTLFRRTGAILRRMEAVHLYHWDATTKPR